MPNVTFIKSVIRNQVYGSDREVLIADVTVSVDNKEYECELRQDDGENHNFDETELNVTIPEPLRSMVQYEAFRVAAQDYHRKVAAGKNGGGFNLEGKEYIRIIGIHFTQDNPYEVFVPGPDKHD